MTKKIAAFLATLITGLALPAQTAPPIPSPAETTPAVWVLTSSVVSQYMFRGTRLGGPAFQPSLEYDAGSLGLGIFVNAPIKDKVSGQSDPEVDYYGFYAVAVAKNLSVVPGITCYTMPRAKKNNGFYPATFEPNIALTYSLGQLSITPKFYYDLILKGPTAELTAAAAIPLKNLGTELDFTVSTGTFIYKNYVAESTPHTKNWGDYYLVGVSLPYQVGKNSKLSISCTYTKGLNNYLKQGTDGKTRNSAALGRGVISLNYIVSF